MNKFFLFFKFIFFAAFFFVCIAIFNSSYTQAVLQQATLSNKKVLVIGLDGTRGDVFHQLLLSQQLPNFTRLLNNGKATSCASSTDSACARTHQSYKNSRQFKLKTAPGWASTITGLESGNHNVRSNDTAELKNFYTTTRTYPSFFKILKDKNKTVAAGGVGAFLTSKNGAGKYYGVVDYECPLSADLPTVQTSDNQSCNLNHRLALENKDKLRDQKLSVWLTELIKNDQADVIMGVFDTIDGAGHSSGFGDNLKYKNAIKNVDSLLEPLLDQVEAAAKNRGQEWLIFVTSDHGGHSTFYGGDHGDEDFEDDAIPFMLSVFSSQPVELKTLKSPVTHMDVFPTLLWWFGFYEYPSNGTVQTL